MSDMLDSTLIDAYLVEAKEHIEKAEENLIEIEKQGTNYDHNLINEVFRSVHTVKGGASFCDLNNINLLAHEVESILDLIRNNKINPNSNLMDQILQSIDKLRALLDDPVASNSIDITPWLEGLENALKGVNNSNEKIIVKEEKKLEQDNMDIKCIDTSDHNIEVQIREHKIKFEYDFYQLKNKIATGNFIYFLYMDLIRDCQEINRTPLDFIHKANFVGEIITSAFLFDLIEEADGIPVSMPLYFLYQSPLEAPHLLGVLDLHEDSIIEWKNPLEETIPSENLSAYERELENNDTPFLPPQKPAETSPQVSVKEEVQNSSASSVFQVTEIKSKQKKTETSLRIDIKLLDKLMSLAGELVLSRNQLMQMLTTNDITRLQNISQRINLITTELQENIMRTRMQPIGNVFNKFPRIVRDLARSLGKDIELVIKGEEVELDKNMVEVLGDPLTHLVRNSIDHGIELPSVRKNANKSPQGTLTLYAYHEGGQVNIDIIDDGAGMDPEKLKAKAVENNIITMYEAEAMSDRDAMNLILYPGFSTAATVTVVSGRGVLMDVVKTNIEKLGGIIDIQSEMGKGSTINIKLPLTLAILPSLIVRSGSERYAIPQINLVELVKVKSHEIHDKVENIQGIEVFRLRGTLLPLLRLSSVLYPGSFKGEIQDINILVLAAGDVQYGLIVDGLNDSEEIVVKPLGKHLKDCKCYAGATIMGDGRVALILDVQGIANYSGLSMDKVLNFDKDKGEDKVTIQEGQAVLLFDNGSMEQFGVSLALVSRIDKIKSSEVETIGGRDLIKYRSNSLPVIKLEKYFTLSDPKEQFNLYIILFNIKGNNIGLIARNIIDTKDLTFNIDTQTLKQPGILGSAIIDNRTTLFLDIFELVQIAEPGWFKERETVKLDERNPTILVVEDSDFFRSHVKKYLEGEGYTVLEGINGAEGFQRLCENKVDLVITDIEMPIMDGYTMAKKIKSDSRFSHVKIIALTAMAGEEDILKGKEAGIDEYQIKFDRESLLDSVAEILNQSVSTILQVR